LGSRTAVSPMPSARSIASSSPGRCQGPAPASAFRPGRAPWAPGSSPSPAASHAADDKAVVRRTPRVDTQLTPAGGAGRPDPAAKAPAGVAVLWFRHDLRLHDNEALRRAAGGTSSLLPAYVFDRREFPSGPRAAAVRAAVQALRDALQGAGSSLVVRAGSAEEELAKLVRSSGASKVYCGFDPAMGDAVEARVRRAVEAEGARLEVVWGGTLLHEDDVPFGPGDVPRNFAAFRSVMETCSVRSPVEAPSSLPGLPGRGSIPLGEIPSLAQLGGGAAPTEEAGGGGERRALRYLEGLSRDPGGGEGGMTLAEYLGQGCLSPRMVYAKLCAGADRGGWAWFELAWRDFYRWVAWRLASEDEGQGKAAKAAGAGGHALSPRHASTISFAPA